MAPPVLDRFTFSRLRTEGRRAREGPVAVTWIPEDTPGIPPGPARVAFAIPRRVGTAVLRNRIRRRLRAANRDLAGELRPGAYLMTARAPAATMPYSDLVDALRGALRAVAGDSREAHTGEAR